MSSSSVDIGTLERAEATFDDLPDLADNLIIKSRSFHRQYASLYFVRLLKLRPAVLAQAKLRWESLPDKPKYVPKVLDTGIKRCYVVGTIYVEMQLKPNVLKDLTEETSISAPTMPRKYKGSEDKISIEDESGRIELVGAILEKEFWVTGTVVALLGKETAAGSFEVQEVCYPGVAPQPPIPQNNDNSKYVALISGLNVGADPATDLKLQLLTEYLTGELGTMDIQKSSSRITRVVIAGNSIGTRQLIEEDQKTKKYGYDSTRYDAAPLNQFDELLEELCASVPVDIMAGEKDPVNCQLPQQPLHPSLFTKAKENATMRSVTNPYWCKMDDVTFLGTSGQNVDDIFKYADSDDPIVMAERCLFWRHIAPSAPDTLWCYPFQDNDPFILDNSPHVYFIGNQRQFEQSTIEGPEGQKVRVVLVPAFSETGSIVLVNLGTLECSEICIDV
ncbi:DNA polymerase alpha/epsilon subunit B-domain-containing protein [Zychaea mexicana]|uniref:DNA polymerase alpha/epsilon subunit B-domain-containing protein n=1 Tax=Zychaea mexicana TaxID=64656 RepID=UPI0022FE72D8|nr:DNA polymerase alpha/epsilon subunit B-domain-containing protein [Zychaea mexicana]KAI9495528.1 DNA polymerase alpha/epsilon subunit B-domain-containing protein [Zychaea mexicana]